MSSCTARTLVLLLTLILSCSEAQPPPPRAEIRKTNATHVAIVPAGGQLPYCLVFAAGADGVVRLQTFTADDLSIECEAGKPIGEQVWTIPSHDDPIRDVARAPPRPILLLASSA